MALRNFTLLTLACHSEEESKYLRACQNHTKKTWIFQAPEAPAPAMKKLLFCWMRKDAGKDTDTGSVDATWRISSSSLRMCARQDCFVFERPQVVFYSNFSSSRHVSKSANLIGCQSQTKKTNPRPLKKKRRFYAWRFSRRCAHSHWRPLFSHEALNVSEYRARNSSRCVRAFRNRIYSRTDTFTMSGFTTAFKAALNERNSMGHRVSYIIMTGLMHSQRLKRRNYSRSS